jgi:hypothetical protein
VTLNLPDLRRFVARTLVHTSGAASPDHAQVASAFNVLCQRLHGRLQPLFGSHAVDALFARSRHLALSEFPWLAGLLREGSDRCALEALDAAPRVVETLKGGLAAVLAHDIALLSAFIGGDLVLPLVQEAWGRNSHENGDAPQG